MNESCTDRYDYVVMSGLFNLNVGQSFEWVCKFVNKMYQLCKEIMAFNMVSSHVNYRDDNMYYSDPSVILSYCIEQLSKRVTLAHHNLPYNYTVVVFRNDVWNSVKSMATD
jgi:hypothetical protein